MHTPKELSRDGIWQQKQVNTLIKDSIVSPPSTITQDSPNHTQRLTREITYKTSLESSRGGYKQYQGKEMNSR